MIFKLNYEHANGSGFIVFESENAATAIAEANLWIDSREKMPDLFGTFLYYQLSPYKIYTIDPGTGSLNGGNGMRLIEWSWDRAGVDRHTFRDWMIEKFDREKA